MSDLSGTVEWCALCGRRVVVTYHGGERISVKHTSPVSDGHSPIATTVPDPTRTLG